MYKIIKRFCSNFNPLVETEKSLKNIFNNNKLLHDICKNINNNEMLETSSKRTYICNMNCKNLKKCHNIKNIDNPL